MSRYVPLKLSARNKRIDWINCIVQVHNLQCGCSQPLEHTLEEIYTQEPTLQIKVPPPCPGSTGDPGTAADADFGEELEKLFEGDFGEPVPTNEDTG